METNIGSQPAADVRDYLAEERTLLAWIRTSLALMGFGFVMARFGLFLEEMRIAQGITLPETHGVSRWFGTAIIAAGIIVNLFAIRRHRRLVGELHRGQSADYAASQEAIILALSLAVVGVAMALYLTLA
jgi:putative membrane protein